MGKVLVTFASFGQPAVILYCKMKCFQKSTVFIQPEKQNISRIHFVKITMYLSMFPGVNLLTAL